MFDPHWLPQSAFAVLCMVYKLQIQLDEKMQKRWRLQMLAQWIVLAGQTRPTFCTREAIIPSAGLFLFLLKTASARSPGTHCDGKAASH
mmetsp:Transcript_8129/g.15353  ORF Transcript_8129/g.15353 Transcript_8129/m.15353 type:complete len:89 (-) Transcript_8129:14-280(-)